MKKNKNKNKNKIHKFTNFHRVIPSNVTSILMNTMYNMKHANIFLEFCCNLSFIKSYIHIIVFPH